LTSNKLELTGLYGITAQEHSRGRGNREVVALMLSAGIRIIQYREKDKSMRERYEECLVLAPMVRAAGGLFIVDDHPDLALAVGADGVHVGQEDLPLAAVRQLVGPGLIVGVSTHGPVQAQKAAQEGADYIGVGPIYPTSTKKDVVPPVGLSYLDWVAAHIGLPFVAIGGIKEHNLPEVVAHGARCAALVTEIVGAPDIPGKVARLQAIMGSAAKA